jgi:hypothetical protein
VELFVHELNVNLLLLKLFAQRNDTDHVPAEDTVALLVVEMAVWVESLLRVYIQNIVRIVHWNGLARNSGFIKIKVLSFVLARLYWGLSDCGFLRSLDRPFLKSFDI